MTSINGLLPAKGLAAQQSPPKLAVGEAIQVRILGPTPSGLSVLIGRQSFQLDVPSRLADVQTLTLQGVSSSSSERRVQITALDGRPLPTPVPATLAPRSQATSPVQTAIVQRTQLQVVAHPVDANGKTLGQGLTLQLQAERPAVAIEAQAGSAKVTATAARPDGSVITPGPGTEPGRHVQLSSTVSGLSESEETRRRGSVPEPVGPAVSRDGPPKGNGSPPVLLPASTKLVDVRPTVFGSAIGEMRQKADPSRLGHNSVTSLPSIDGEAMPVKSTVVSAASTYRSGVTYGPLAPSSVPAKPPPPAQLQVASEDVRPDASRTMKATVIARTDVGQIVLKAADQLLRVEQPIDLPIGTTLQATFASGASVPSMSFSPGLSDDQASPLTRLITLLDSIDRAGRQSDLPDEPFPGRQLPAPDKNLASRLLELLTAGAERQPQSGQLPSADRGSVTSAQKDQIQALVRDLAGTASEPLVDGWKSLTLPIGHDQAQAVCCYFRHHELDPEESGSDDADDRRDDAERAVFDVSLSRLGRCQIDALCQEQRFDLMIRTEERLSEADRQDIASLFLSASEIAGMKGEIGFRKGGFFEPARLPAAARDFRT